MSLNPIQASNQIMKKYLRYIDTTFFIKDEEYRSQFKSYLDNGEYFAKGPYLDFSDSFKSGLNILDLINEGVLNSDFKILFNSEKKRNLLYRKLYLHQENAIRKIKEDKNLIVTTGTGSGKTEAFLYPIINYLMNQKKKGLLNSGVRALIIYPMNALVNDQKARMRDLLSSYPDITFGSYTGESEETEYKARSKYFNLYKKDPLINEKLSREEMKKNPPNILITNYAMLEYLMIRPKDTVFFSGNSSKEWKFIVLDEAHTYTGAKGIEVSMLLRRLKNVLNNCDNIRFILTSATLGGKKDNSDICDFASRLCCDSIFNEDSIVRASRYSNFDSTNSRNYNPQIYNEINEALEENDNFIRIKNIINNYDSNFNSKSTELNEYLFDFIIQDKFYYRIRTILKKEPVTIEEIANDLNIDENSLVSFVSISSKAACNNKRLLDAKYHMFIRSIEGVYIVIGKNKQLFITPRDKIIINNEEYKCYKMSVCKYCGQIYIEGDEVNGYLLPSNKTEYQNHDFSYMLLDDKIDLLHTNVPEYDDFEIFNLCGKCGHIDNARHIVPQSCDCGDENIVQIIKIPIKDNIIRKCISCEQNNVRGSILRGFYLGQVATASVICSSLYEELPAHKIEIVENIIEADDDFFGDEESTGIVENLFEKKLSKQLLVFSDSRQDAAFFATYFDFTYNNMLKKRLLVEALSNIKNVNPQKGIEVLTVVEKLKELLEFNNILKSTNCEKEAWKIILAEISNNGRNSLEKIGLISFEFQIEGIGHIGKKFYGDEVSSLFRVLTNDFLKYCMLKYPIINEMTKEDKSDFTYDGKDYAMTLESESEGLKYGIKTWFPGNNNNSRVDYLKKILKTKDMDIINKYLRKFWNKLISSNYIVLSSPGKYLLDIKNIKIRTPQTHKIQWYICDKCGKVTINNINDICPEYRCKGSLKAWDFNNDFLNNHYRKQFLEMEISSMIIKEHTAQLSVEKAKLYQDDFIKNKINILSCSTTFEMGVDVGDLETVFMKNMPPSPANYTQRAGRAGRRNDSVAYALTFCRLASHDLMYFKDPKKMIKGQILPPKFKIENEKIVKRHLNSSIIAAFWREYPDLYKTVGVFFDEANFEYLLNFIKLLNNSFTFSDKYKYIFLFIPESLRAKTLDWLKVLVSEKGILNREYKLYKEEIKQLSIIRQEYIDKITPSESNGRILYRIDRYINKIDNENIISFLSKKNIIPKYGFPVDTVELTTPFSINSDYDNLSDLRLQRDLMIAISEYAPGSEIIADGKIYTSKYIKRPFGKNLEWTEKDFGFCIDKSCNQLNLDFHSPDNVKSKNIKCLSCNNDVFLSKTLIIPEYGFICSPKVVKATTKKPVRTYSSEIYYIGNNRGNEEPNEFRFNTKVIKIISTADDELAVINTSEFFVCNTCGYAIVDNKYSSKSSKKKSHDNPYGKKCENEKLYRKSLGHVFKTDVVSLVINEYLENANARSVLYALLEGTSQYLGIERNEISGTLRYSKSEFGEWTTNFILFDTVPGGAGHVRRIGIATKTGFLDLIRKSLKIVKECTCGGEEGDSSCYSCLCNYYNQRYHNILKRRYAIDFFEELLK